MEAVRDEEGFEGLATSDVARAGQGPEGGAVVGFLACDEVCAGGLALPEEVLDGELEGGFDCFRA